LGPYGDLHPIALTTLVIGRGSRRDAPSHLQEMAAHMPGGSYLLWPSGSHLAMDNDQETYRHGS
jgi:proline iminopeptidase